MREVGEEVGNNKSYQTEKVTGHPLSLYEKRSDNKSVHYYLFLSDGRETLINQIQEGIHDTTWMPFDTALSVIGYKKTNTPLLIQTQKFLITYGH